MDDAIELSSYLPDSFRTPEEEEYTGALWNSFEMNYLRGQYQFAFLAYHMLTMSFVYFNIWQIKQAYPSDFANSLIGFRQEAEREILRAESPFVLSMVPERTVFNFLKLLDCDYSMIGRYKRLVDKRNDSAHANGSIAFREVLGIDEQIAEMLRMVDEIQASCRPVIEQLYRRFLVESGNPEEREHIDVGDQVREVLVRENYMSSKDIEICVDLDVGDSVDGDGEDEGRSLHLALCEIYSA